MFSLIETVNFQQRARICSAQSDSVQPVLNNTNTKHDGRADSMTQGHDEIDHVLENWARRWRRRAPFLDTSCVYNPRLSL
jgi:hypothetical protein